MWEHLEANGGQRLHCFQALALYPKRDGDIWRPRYRVLCGQAPRPVYVHTCLREQMFTLAQGRFGRAQATFRYWLGGCVGKRLALARQRVPRRQALSIHIIQQGHPDSRQAGAHSGLRCLRALKSPQASKKGLGVGPAGMSVEPSSCSTGAQIYKDHHALGMELPAAQKAEGPSEAVCEATRSFRGLAWASKTDSHPRTFCAGPATPRTVTRGDRRAESGRW